MYPLVFRSPHPEPLTGCDCISHSIRVTLCRVQSLTLVVGSNSFCPCDFIMISCTKSHTRGLWLTNSICVTLYRVQSIGLLMVYDQPILFVWLYVVYKSIGLLMVYDQPILFVWLYVVYKVSHSLWALTNPFYPCDLISCTKSRTPCGLWLTHSIRVTWYRVQSLTLLVGSLFVCCSISPLSLSVFSKWKTIVSVVLSSQP